MEGTRCHVCGEPAVEFFGSLPLCQNVTCHTYTVEMINQALADAAEASKADE